MLEITNDNLRLVDRMRTIRRGESVSSIRSRTPTELQDFTMDMDIHQRVKELISRENSMLSGSISGNSFFPRGKSVSKSQKKMIKQVYNINCSR